MIIPLTPQTWLELYRHVLPFVVEAVAESQGDWDVGDVDIRILRGDLLAWLVVHEGRPAAFIAGEFVHYPRYTVFNVTFAAGRLQSSVKEIEQLCNLVKLGGAKYVEAHCDDRRARLFQRYGFRAIRNVVRKSLDDPPVVH